MSHKIPGDIVLGMINDIHPDVEIIGDYKSKGSPLRVKCSICGFVWDSTANRLLSGHGCRKCAGMKKRQRRGYFKKTHEQFMSELKSVAPDIQVLSTYETAITPVKCSCVVCGNVWSARPSNLLTGIGCPACANIATSFKQIKSQDEFVSEMADTHPSITVIGRYAGNKCKVSLVCNLCGNTWEAMPINLLRGDGKSTGCPRCRRSHGESAIANWLLDNMISYEPQKTFDKLVGVGGRLLSYDFYIPNYNMLIEYQGQYHDNTARNQTDDGYCVQVEHDKRKRVFAERNGIKLFEIWYYENIEEKLAHVFDNIKDPVTTKAS